MGKISKKAEAFQILRNSGKSLHDAYKLAGFKGNSVSAPYKVEGNIKQHALTDPKLLKISKKVAKHVLEIAEDALKGRRDDPAIQTLCVKAAMRIIEGQQDRIEPKKNLNFNANIYGYVDADPIDLEQYRLP
ncbi:conserved hypothetical protein [Candidatus Brocadia pituitae]|nr:conserved hypothetical protein [Candidatus Brocadia pituitae]